MQRADPDVVIHQLTAFGDPAGDPLQGRCACAPKARATSSQPARQSGARRFIAQSISFICTPLTSGLTDEDTPLHLDAPPAIRALAQAVAELEDQTLQRSGLHGVVLRYGWFYGPGTNYDPADAIPRAIRKGRMAIVGGGNGTYSFVHVHDAAVATMKALQHAPPGIYNIVDDAPVTLKQWLPVAAQAARCAGAGSHGRGDGARKAGRHARVRLQRAVRGVQSEGQAGARLAARDPVVGGRIQAPLRIGLTRRALRPPPPR